MEALLHQLVAGLATGCIYGLIGLALVVVHRSTHHINFAQGEMAMFSTYGAWALIQAGLSFWWTFVVVLALSFATAALLEKAVIRRLQRAGPVATVSAFIGLLMIVHSMAGYIWGHDVRQFPSPFPDLSIAGGLISGHQIGVAAVTVALLTVLWAFFRFTRIGLAMKASVQNPESALLSGISTASMYALGWGLAAAIGAAAGMLIAPQLYLDTHMMSGVLIYGLAAALLGGIDSPPGAVLGGLLVGVAENLLGAYVTGTELKLTVALFLIVAVLMLRPQGLIGRKSAMRV